MNSTPRKTVDSEKPLRGAIICCTSLSPEQRSELAQIVDELGGKLYLDLTSDVTHLLVGQVSTPKYKYVAREREDVKVVKPEFVYAVRDAWTLGGALDLEDLEETHRLSTFAGLSICVTGFDDLTFRSQLQEAIESNGGIYKGDLTKSVTHLVAKTAEGKKYQYAQQWQITTVSLKWFKDSLERGLVLEESVYHPTLPSEEQGKGAWNRKPANQSHLGKRSREPDSAPIAPRKLRRTTSARLGSQSDAMWGDIVGNNQIKAEPEEREPLRQTKSMSDINVMVQQSRSFATDTTTTHREPSVSENQNHIAIVEKRGILDGCVFVVAGFGQKQTAILQNILTANGADLVHDFQQPNEGRRRLLLVPFSSEPDDVPQVDGRQPPMEIVTDLWVEKCLHTNKFIEPSDYVPSKTLQYFPIKGFEKLVLNSTTFDGIEVLHLSKLVSLMGAKYDEYFKPSVSVLVAKRQQLSEDKLLHAYQWRIPVVNADWFWSCARTGICQPYKPYLVKIPSGIKAKVERLAQEAQAEEASKHRRPRLGDGFDQHAEAKDRRVTEITDLAKTSRTSAPKKLKPGTDLIERNDSNVTAENVDHSEGRGLLNEMKRPLLGSECGTPDSNLPLREISANSPPKSQTPRQEKPACGPCDGCDDISQQAAKSGVSSEHFEQTETLEAAQSEPKTESINNAIKDLLRKNKSSVIGNSSTGNSQSKKKRLLGRALSNLSNSSWEGTAARPSRASSIDSMNTDGIGSVILDDTSQVSRPRNDSHGATDSGVRSFNEALTGRARAKESDTLSDSLTLDERHYYEEPHATEDTVPLMTQLGWDDPDEAKQLRKLMVEKRKDPGKSTQKEVSAGLQQPKKIRDDDALVGSKWGGGRRTRPKTRSPKRLGMIF